MSDYVDPVYLANKMEFLAPRDKRRADAIVTGSIVVVIALLFAIFIDIGILLFQFDHGKTIGTFF